MSFSVVMQPIRRLCAVVSHNYSAIRERDQIQEQ